MATENLETDDVKIEKRIAIIDALYDMHAGEHLHAQQRASYRRDVASSIMKKLDAIEEEYE